MTWNQIIDSTVGGNGVLEYRLVIEGFDYCFVTAQEMANNSVQPKRINGLLRTGVQLSQEIALPEATLNLNSNNFTIVDYQEQATIAFCRKPTFTAYLVQNISPADTTLTVSNITGLNVGDYLWIGSESMRVMGLIVGASLPQVIVQRGCYSSTPQAHYTLTDLGLPIRPLIQNCPFTIERRRAYLFAYGSGDDMQGNGTLIWRGVVKTQPVIRGTNYAIQVGPITELLKTEISVDAEEVKLRGINLGAYKWVINMEFLNGSDLKTSPVTSEAIIYASGFYEDIYALAADLNLQALLASSAVSNVRCGVQITNDGELIFTQQTDLATATCRFTTVMPPTKYKGSTAVSDYFTFEPENYAYQVFNNRVAVEKKTRSISTDATFATRLVNKAFPTQLTIYTTNPPLEGMNNYAANGNFGKRLYVNTDTTNTYLTDLSILGTDGSAIAQVYYANYTKADLVVDNSARYIETNLYFNQPVTQKGDFVIVNNDYKIALATSFDQGRTDTVANNVVDFIDAIIEKSPENTPNGVISLITSNDIDNADMRVQINKLSLKPFQANRKWIFSKKSDTLEKILNEEFKLIGVFPALTADGKLTFKSLRNINPYEEPDYTIDADDILTDKSFPVIESNKYGVYNSVKIKNGYNPATQKFESPDIVQNNIESIQIYGRAKQIEIAAIGKTQYASNQVTAHISDFEDIMYRATSLLARDYWVMTVEVPLKFFSIPLGSTIRIKNKQVPNFTPNFNYLTSRRGSGRILGRVTGKNFNLETGFGSLTILISDQEYQGTDSNVKAIYAPDCLISTVTSLGGGFYSLALDTTYSSLLVPSGQTLSSYFNVNDGIRLDRWNSTTQDTGYGSIAAITGTGNALTLIVNLNSPGSAPSGIGTSTNKYTVKVSDINYTGTTTAQKVYAFFDGGSLGSDNTNYPGTFNRILSF
jgi:hypothetical protein